MVEREAAGLCSAAGLEEGGAPSEALGPTGHIPGAAAVAMAATLFAVMAETGLG